jgi:hypothetical protein
MDPFRNATPLDPSFFTRSVKPHGQRYRMFLFVLVAGIMILAGSAVWLNRAPLAQAIAFAGASPTPRPSTAPDASPTPEGGYISITPEPMEASVAAALDREEEEIASAAALIQTSIFDDPEYPFTLSYPTGWKTYRYTGMKTMVFYRGMMADPTLVVPFPDAMMTISFEDRTAKGVEAWFDAKYGSGKPRPTGLPATTPDPAATLGPSPTPVIDPNAGLEQRSVITNRNGVPMVVASYPDGTDVYFFIAGGQAVRITAHYPSGREGDREFTVPYQVVRDSVYIR